MATHAWLCGASSQGRLRPISFFNSNRIKTSIRNRFGRLLFIDPTKGSRPGQKIILCDIDCYFAAHFVRLCDFRGYCYVLAFLPGPGPPESNHQPNHSINNSTARRAKNSLCGGRGAQINSQPTVASNTTMPRLTRNARFTHAGPYSLVFFRLLAGRLASWLSSHPASKSSTRALRLSWPLAESKRITA